MRIAERQVSHIYCQQHPQNESLSVLLLCKANNVGNVNLSYNKSCVFITFFEKIRSFYSNVIHVILVTVKCQSVFLNEFLTTPVTLVQITRFTTCTVTVL